MVALKTIRLGQSPDADLIRQHCVLGDEIGVSGDNGQIKWLSCKTLGHKTVAGEFHYNIIAIYGDKDGSVRIAIDLGKFSAGVYDRLLQMQASLTPSKFATFWRSISHKCVTDLAEPPRYVEFPSAQAPDLGPISLRRRCFADAAVDSYVVAGRRQCIGEMELLFTTGGFAIEAA